MVDQTTIMKSGRCIECGALELDQYSCYEQFGFPLAWEQQNPELYALHFWLVSCYMIQHPSNFTDAGYELLVGLFRDAYDHDWDTATILGENRRRILNVGKIANPLPHEERSRTLKSWTGTINDIYIGGEARAIDNIQKWRDVIRREL
ncbi:DUF5946 family protein [Paenibacillus lactis]|uniref:DUF5946 family protein n=1 Tax=Paenibacillus lactis TaxID=228574 RepID=UPI0011A4B0FC